MRSAESFALPTVFSASFKASWISAHGDLLSSLLERLDVTFEAADFASLMMSWVPAGISVPSSMSLSSMICLVVVLFANATDDAVAPLPAVTSLTVSRGRWASTSPGAHSFIFSAQRARMGVPSLPNMRYVTFTDSTTAVSWKEPQVNFTFGGLFLSVEPSESLTTALVRQRSPLTHFVRTSLFSSFVVSK